MDKYLSGRNELYRPTWVEIDLSAIDYNLKLVKEIVGAGEKILAVVKSDAYGHGMLKVAGHIAQEVDFLGVASIDEALVLRRSKIKKPILIFESCFPHYAEAVAQYDLTPTVCSLVFARSLNLQAARFKKKVNVHIKIDTGMGRLGIWHSAARKFIKGLKRFSNLHIEGLYTHFPCADTDKEFTLRQIADFKFLIRQLRQDGIHIPICHAANSMGVIGYKESYFDMVRPGLMIYGLYPKDNLEPRIKLKSALSLKSKVIFVKKTPPGRSIGYGATHITKKTTYIATIPVGYNDGYLRSLSNEARVLIRGKGYKIIGRICMDQLMVDVLNKGVRMGDEVTLIGKDKNSVITVEEVSRLAGTIPYEIACSIGNSAQRFYIKERPNGFLR